jgi:hypothetical protein
MAEENEDLGLAFGLDTSQKPPPGTFLTQKTGLNTTDINALVNGLKAGWNWDKTCRLVSNVERGVLANWKDEIHRKAGIAPKGAVVRAAPARAKGTPPKSAAPRAAKAVPLAVVKSVVKSAAPAPAKKVTSKARKAR